MISLTTINTNPPNSKTPASKTATGFSNRAYLVDVVVGGDFGFGACDGAGSGFGAGCGLDAGGGVADWPEENAADFRVS